MNVHDIPHRTGEVTKGATTKWQQPSICPLKAAMRMDASLQAKFIAFQGSMLTPEAFMGKVTCEG